MPKIKRPGEAYSHRRCDAVVMNTTMDAEAVAIVHTYVPPGRRGTGQCLARLLYEQDAWVQERQRVQEQGAMTGGNT